MVHMGNISPCPTVFLHRYIFFLTSTADCFSDKEQADKKRNHCLTNSMPNRKFLKRRKERSCFITDLRSHERISNNLNPGQGTVRGSAPLLPGPKSFAAFTFLPIISSPDVCEVRHRSLQGIPSCLSTTSQRAAAPRGSLCSPKCESNVVTCWKDSLI